MPTINHVASWKPPDPWEISKIKPEIHFYVAGQPPIKSSWTESAEVTLAELEAAQFLDLKRTTAVIIITHGFENDIDTPWLAEMKDAILEVNPLALVCLLGWGGGANIGILKYTQAAGNTQAVGRWFSPFVSGIRKMSSSLYIWAIGHSLGAHLLGRAGRECKGAGFSRLTGLDPAGPSFEKVNIENRLCKTDAEVVDVIHTDGYDTVFDPSDWFAPVNHYGTLIPLGTVDFYPNFGFSQPGISHFSIAGSHHRSIELFLWSISNGGSFKTNAVIDGMPAFETPVEKIKYAQVEAEMGYHFDCKLDGLFYIETCSAVPWMKPQEDKDNNFVHLEFEEEVHVQHQHLESFEHVLQENVPKVMTNESETERENEKEGTTSGWNWPTSYCHIS